MPDEIGTLFHEAQAPPMSVDPDAVIAGGRRRRRRRNLTAVGGTAAAALVLGVGGWAVLSQETAEDQTLPAATSSPTADGTTVEGPTTEVPLGAIPPTGRTMPVVATFAFDEAGSHVGFTLKAEDGTVLATRTRPEPRSGRELWATLVPGVTLAVLPDTATSAVPVWTRGEQRAEGSATAEAPDGRLVVAWWTDASTRDPFADVVWTDGQTAYAKGLPLETVIEDDLILFAGGGVGLVGYLRPADAADPLGGGEAKAAKDMEPGSFPAVWADGPDGTSGTYVAFLPPVEDVDLVTTGDARVRDLTVHDFGDVRGLLVVADVEGTRQSVTAVEYTDPEFAATPGQPSEACGPGQFRSGCGMGRPGCSPPRASR
jgi:hypothetical protein